jgi:5-methyltetrahydropteroyltriglutamate--homocysteine methyltransferase
MITAKQRGEPYDETALQRRITAAVRDVVKKQADTGIDIVNDGEFSKSSWAAYFSGRLSGVEVRPGQMSMPPHGIIGRDERVFPDWFAAARAGGGPSASSYVLRAAIAARGRPVAGITGAFCTGPIKYTGQAEVRTDIANLKAAVDGLDVEPCLTALAPPTMTYFLKNEHYGNDRDFMLRARGGDERVPSDRRIGRAAAAGRAGVGDAVADVPGYGRCAVPRLGGHGR